MTRAPDSMTLPFDKELVVDLFAGGGGASMGIARAYKHPDVAVNHNRVAIAVHAANHPHTRHYTSDVFEVDPIEATGGRPVGLLWMSPDCTHHSKAKGGKPRSKKLRGLAWVAIRWAAAVRPRVIQLENVEEFADWGPLLADGRPCQTRKGMTFRRWKRQLEKLGYHVEHRELVAADYGAPTIRKRLYVVARCDGLPVVWPAPTHHRHGAKGLEPWRTAAECIDWALPSRSIFDRAKPLATNTLRRIAKGMVRHVLTASPLESTHAPDRTPRPLQQPLASGWLARRNPERATRVRGAGLHGDGGGRSRPSPVSGLGHTSDGGAGAPHAIAGTTLTAAFLEQANGGFYAGDGRSIHAPLSTICASGANQRLVTAYFIKYYGTATSAPITDPLHTITAKARMGLVNAIPSSGCLTPAQVARAKACADFLRRHAPDRFASLMGDVVVFQGHVLVDITLRMLEPRELAAAQGFNADYVLDQGADGMAVSKTNQLRLIGNSVCPDVAEAITRAQLADVLALYATAA